MKVELEQIRKMAHLSRLSLSPEEEGQMANSLTELVQYIDKIQSLDLAGVEPMMHVDESPRALRVDSRKPTLPKDQVFKNAPDVNLEHFSIPKVMGG
jgi:aspartyl-tRNA(Asn)/glutamyl-tRNA(Gln) amidotransferase subunit C